MTFPRILVLGLLAATLAACTAVDFWRAVYEGGKNYCEQQSNCETPEKSKAD
ncbi:MAG: hypothetical protein VW405_15915 [Rhodospirillaceae bacterium]